jgi:hypothetical protein
MERLEGKQLPAAGALAAPLAHRMAGLSVSASRPSVSVAADAPATPRRGTITPDAVKPNFGYLVYRITNPSGAPNIVAPPFGHVQVQGRRPVPGQHYNILLVAVKNATNQTFDARSGFFVRLPHQPYTPILKGDETWKPGQFFIFYALTKAYYPLPNQVSDGYEFKLAGAWSVAIPGPSGIFLRIKYDPATINKILDYAVLRGPGAQGGTGIPTGMADTALWAFTSAKENRKDFGGYF